MGIDPLLGGVSQAMLARRSRAVASRGTRARVADRDDISALVYRYAELLDGGDLDGVTDMFADATWRSAATGAALRRAKRSRGLRPDHPLRRRRRAPATSWTT